VVLLHALGVTREMWWPQLEAIRPNFRAVTIDIA